MFLDINLEDIGRSDMTRGGQWKLGSMKRAGGRGVVAWEARSANVCPRFGAQTLASSCRRPPLHSPPRPHGAPAV
jgi:hypothetical protein